MLKYKFACIFVMFIMIWGCSQYYSSRNRPYIPPKDYSVLEPIDSNYIMAAVKPYGYKWNEGENLVDLIRKKYKPPQIKAGYPNTFSPPTFIDFSIMNSDSIKFYLCNTNESSCFKIQEDYFEKGTYSLGFQRLDVDTGVYVLKAETSDSTFMHKYLLIP